MKIDWSKLPKWEGEPEEIDLDGVIILPSINEKTYTCIHANREDMFDYLVEITDRNKFIEKALIWIKKDGFTPFKLVCICMAYSVAAKDNNWPITNDWKILNNGGSKSTEETGA